MSYDLFKITLLSGLSLLLIDGLIGCEEVEPPCGCSAPAPELTQTAAQLAIAGRWQPSAEAEARGQAANVPITEAGPWQGESVSCSGTFTEGAQRVREWLFTYWPQITDIQGYSCRPINGNSSSTSIHAVGRALDIFIPLDDGEADNELGDPVANYLMLHAEEMGVQRVIWDRTIWTAGRSSYEYGGAHPHHDHLHIELSVPGGNQEPPFFQEGLPPPELPACAPPLSAEGGVIDSESPCLSLFGPARFWRSVEGEGHNGSLYWTNAFQNDRPSNWARWRFRVSQSGRYTLEAHSVPQYSVYPDVRYELSSADGVEERVVRMGGQRGWVSLGEAHFEAGEREFYVDLFDNYSAETGSDQHIIVDALRLTALNPPPEPPPEGGEGGGMEPPPEAGGDAPPTGGGEPPSGGSPSPPSAGEVSPSGGADGRPIPMREPEAAAEEGSAGLPWQQMSEAKQSSGATGCAQRAQGAPSMWILALMGLIGLTRRQRDVS